MARVVKLQLWDRKTASWTTACTADCFKAASFVWNKHYSGLDLRDNLPHRFVVWDHDQIIQVIDQRGADQVYISPDKPNVPGRDEL